MLCGYSGKMREALVKVKQPTPELDKKGVVYEVPCGECNYVYIGEMGRTLRKRLTEHRVAVKKCDKKNGIAVHAWKSGVGICQSEVSCTKPRPQKDCGGSTYLPDTEHDKPGLWLNPFDSFWFPLLT